MNEQISLDYHQAKAVAERAARVRKLARQHKGYGVTERTRVVVFIGNPYYSEPNPALHGLYLKVEGGGAPVPLFAKDLGYDRNFEEARLGMRDENGHVQHPDMDGIGWDEFDMGPQLRALGWASTTVSFESDADQAAQDRYSDSNSPDCSYWTPTPPEGAGWLMAAIYDTEDGPVALFVRAADDVAALDWAGVCTVLERHFGKGAPMAGNLAAALDATLQRATGGMQGRTPASEHPLLKPFDDPATGAAFAEAMDQGKGAAGMWADDEAYRQHQRDRIAEAQRHDAGQAKPKLTDGVGVGCHQTFCDQTPMKKETP